MSPFERPVSVVSRWVCQTRGEWRQHCISLGPMVMLVVTTCSHCMMTRIDGPERTLKSCACPCVFRNALIASPRIALVRLVALVAEAGAAGVAGAVIRPPRPNISLSSRSLLPVAGISPTVPIPSSIPSRLSFSFFFFPFFSCVRVR